MSLAYEEQGKHTLLCLRLASEEAHGEVGEGDLLAARDNRALGSWRLTLFVLRVEISSLRCRGIRMLMATREFWIQLGAWVSSAFRQGASLVPRQQTAPTLMALSLCSPTGQGDRKDYLIIGIYR